MKEKEVYSQPTDGSAIDTNGAFTASPTTFDIPKQMSRTANYADILIILSIKLLVYFVPLTIL
jgi:hypothetical protein